MKEKIKVERRKIVTGQKRVCWKDIHNTNEEDGPSVDIHLALDRRKFKANDLEPMIHQRGIIEAIVLNVTNIKGETLIPMEKIQEIINKDHSGKWYKTNWGKVYALTQVGKTRLWAEANRRMERKLAEENQKIFINCQMMEVQ